MKIGLLFDLDGTLLDTLGDLTDATNYALSQFGLPLRTQQEIRSFVGNGAKRQITLAMGAEENDPRVDTVLAVYKQYYDAHCQIRTAPYPGIPEALAQLTDFSIAIVSNKPHVATAMLAERYFPGIYARGEQAGITRKPAPDMLFKTMEDLGVEKCVYIGDSEVDILTAQNAAVPCVSVTWGFRDEPDLLAAGATHLCHNAADLKRLLLEEKLWPPKAPEL
jgi:phosphoglycolate phosphatase